MYKDIKMNTDEDFSHLKIGDPYKFSHDLEQGMMKGTIIGILIMVSIVSLLFILGVFFNG
jgi:hypothetical protein